MSARRRVGVLVMSYGTPASMDEIDSYYTHIRHGRPPSEEQLNELKGRYEAIVGGFFPLRRNTDKQVSVLQETLRREHPEIDYVCYQGLKHAFPFIEDGVNQIAKDGITEAVGIVLAPHFSTMSVGDYSKRAKEKADELGINMSFVLQYHLHPKLLQALSERVNRELEKFLESGVPRDQVRVIFSAHSLPEKILDVNDPYPKQLLETSEAIVQRTGIRNWQFAWQSAGQTAIPWLGPDIMDVLRAIHKEEHVNNVLMCPVGFVSDHLEVLYDIDIECKGLAQELGMRLERTESLNTDPLYMEALSDVIDTKAKEMVKA